MSDSQFLFFLDCAVGLCAVMVVVSLIRACKRGLHSYFLGGGYAAMGTLLFAMHEKWSNTIIIVLAIIVGACLVADFLIRAAQRGANH